MPRRHQKGDVTVPTFHASGTGRDLYLDPNKADVADAPRAQPLHYTDIETGERCTLRWWTRLPASGEYKTRLKRQKAMANRYGLNHPPTRTETHWISFTLLFTTLCAPCSAACHASACLCRVLTQELVVVTQAKSTAAHRKDNDQACEIAELAGIFNRN